MTFLLFRSTFIGAECAKSKGKIPINRSFCSNGPADSTFRVIFWAVKPAFYTRPDTMWWGRQKRQCFQGVSTGGFLHMVEMQARGTCAARALWGQRSRVTDATLPNACTWSTIGIHMNEIPMGILCYLSSQNLIINYLDEKEMCVFVPKSITD